MKSFFNIAVSMIAIALPFLMMFTWALFKNAYQQLTIVLLIGIFYLLPKKRLREDAVVDRNSNQTLG
jgi:hypothetical protein